jgi:hypothetical protein
MYSMTTGFKEIEQLRIVLDTNIQNQKEHILSRNLLKYDDTKHKKIDTSKWSNFPYFSSSIIFPREELQKLSYDDLIQTFFDRRAFQGFVQKHSEVSSDAGARETTIEKNILVLLECLLPTYPYSNQVFSSIENLNDKPKKPTNSNTLSKPPTQGIIIDTKEYSIQNIIWLNDLFHHPKYETIIEQFETFRYWQESTRQDILSKIETMSENIKQKVEEQLRWIREFYTSVPPTLKAEYTRKYRLEDNIRTMETKVASHASEPDYDSNTRVDIINGMFSLMNNMQTKTFIRFSNTTISNKYTKNKREIEELYIHQTILDKYFQNAIDFSFDDDNMEVKSYFGIHYSKYTEFANQLKQLASPIRKSTNSVFQNSLEAFLKGTNREFEKNVLAAETKPLPDSLKSFVYVGASILKDNPKYEIYVQINLANRSNTSLVGEVIKKSVLSSCSNTNDELVHLFEELRTPQKQMLQRRNMIEDIGAVGAAAAAEKKQGGNKKYSKNSTQQKKRVSRRTRKSR